MHGEIPMFRRLRAALVRGKLTAKSAFGSGVSTMTRPLTAGRLTAPATGASALVGLILLAGCSFFSHSVTWTKDGATEDQAQNDLASCQERADVQTGKDRDINRDIAAADGGGTSGIDTSPLQNMQTYHDDRRYKSILKSCMTELGYREVE
jgi:hypothetical protein